MCPLGFKNDGLQISEYLYDFAVDGGATSQIVLSAKEGYKPIPVGAIITKVQATIITACVGSSSTVAVGNVTDDDGFIEAIAEATLVAGYCANSERNGGAKLWDDTEDASIDLPVAVANDGKIGVKIGTAALTAGKFSVAVHWFLPKNASA